jgi:hypothetical protein
VGGVGKSDNNTLLRNCESASQQRQPEAISSSRELSSNGKPSSSATTMAQSNKVSCYVLCSLDIECTLSLFQSFIVNG